MPALRPLFDRPGARWYNLRAQRPGLSAGHKGGVPLSTALDLTRPAGFFSRCGYAVYLAITLLVLGLYVLRGPHTALVALLCAVGLLAGVPLLSFLGGVGERLGWKRSLVLLLALCFVLKLAWVLLVRIDPQGDYQVFYDHAVAFSQQETLGGSRYLALFPHIFGYSFFLSLVMKAFGTSYLVAPITNVVLSTLSCALLFFLCRRLGGLKTAVVACGLWIVFPSQIIYNMFALSEPLYTTLLLAVLLLFAVFDQRSETAAPLPTALLGLGAGALLALVNLCRPVAAILIIGLVLWLALVRLDGWREKKFRRSALLFLAGVLVCYVAVGQAGNAYLAYRIGEEPSSVPGYNIMVGFNQDSGGTWNQADSDLLYSFSGEEGATASYAQEQMLQAAVERITSGEIDFVRLMLDKVYTFLCRDDSCVMYAQSVLRHTGLFFLLCNGFYYITLILAAVGVVDAFRRKDRSALFLVMVYFVGLTLAHMLVEVAGRYHYSLLIPLVVLGAKGALALADWGGKLRKAHKRA